MVNSVLTALPTYWMSIFRLPAWVIKKIDQLRRDFLWTGPDIDNPVFRLVSCNSPHQNASVCDLAHLLTMTPFTEWAEGHLSRVMLRNIGEGIRDIKSKISLGMALSQ